MPIHILGLRDIGATWFFLLMLIVILSLANSFHAGGEANKRTIRRKRTRLHVRIREWQDEDVDQIQSLLSDTVPASFDPEGPLTVDCGSSKAILESYNEGGCFLVAIEDDNKSEILGTAALTVGTQISYLKSGASISTPTITGAVRRVCTANSTRDNESILRLLLKEIEARANILGADELIMLAYPSARRPSSDLVERLGYRELPATLRGVDATQYAKVLDSATESNIAADDKIVTENNNSSTIAGTAIAALFTTFLLVSFGFIANFMGLEVLPSPATVNRGVGTPLSIEEVWRLKEDEKLKRSDIDVKQTNRQWEELGDEERREEAALMKIIQGEDVRIRPTTR